MSSGPWELPDELRQLAESGDENLVKEVLAVFRTDTADRITKLKAAFARDDRTAVKEQAHSMKGSSGQVGAAVMSSICRQLEAEAMTAPAESVAEMIRRVDTAFADVLAAMAA